MNILTAQARAFINRFQGGFPVEKRPFRSVASQLGMDEASVIRLVRHLLDRKQLSRFGPLYDATNLGGSVSLAAMSVPNGDFDRVAGQVNALPEVSHNYRRDHTLNMWFVVACANQQGLVCALDYIRDVTGLPVFAFPKIEEFYLGFWLEVDPTGAVRTIPVPGPVVPHCDPVPLDETDRQIVAATQAGLPVVSEPYAQLARETGLAAEAFRQRLEAMLARGVIRRIGAIPNHYALGLRSNGMTVWDVPDEHAQALGRRIGAIDFVSHAYLRPRHPGLWRYNLFAMVHGRNRAEVRAKAAWIKSTLGEHARAHDILFSTAILKKTGLRLAA